MKFFIRAAASLMAVISLQAAADGDASAGQAKSAICAACHGPDGNSAVPNWPKLAGQHAGYLERQTALIKSGARPVPEMMGIVAGMSEQDLRDLAAYFSSQTNNARPIFLFSNTLRPIFCNKRWRKYRGCLRF